jgi:primosomal replication protein N
MNRLLLTAQLVERGAARYTPAGLPAFDLSLKHESQLSEDGTARTVRLEIRAVAIGDISRQVGGLALGETHTYAGFLAATRNGRGLVFHVTAID